MYLKILKYCKEKDGIVINRDFGESFGKTEEDRFDKLRKELFQRTYYPIGFANDRGFFLKDLSSLGIYNASGLINFLVAQNGKYKIIDSRGSDISIGVFKRLMLTKGTNTHWRDGIRQEYYDELEKASNILQRIIEKQDKEINNIDQMYVNSAGYQLAVKFREEISDIVERIGEINGWKFKWETGESPEGRDEDG